MKPINSKEKSKQVWRFLIVFMGLAFLPLAIVFFSYYKVPDKISATQAEKLVAYSNFEHAQKVIIQQMAELDSNINLYATASVPNPELLGKKIVDGLADLSRKDTSIRIVKLASDAYANHYTHVKALVDAQAQLKKATVDLQDAQEKLKASESEKQMLMMGAAASRMPPME